MPINDKTKNQNTETHPLLPSGEWDGFYCYHYSAEQHKMFIELHFADSVVSGSGVDDIASFTWTGKYNLETFKIEMIKYYPTYKVWYKGDIDENGIWGTWELAYDYAKIPPDLLGYLKEALKNDLTGGFHIWPKKSKSETNSNSLEEQAESQKLKEIFTEIFA